MKCNNCGFENQQNFDYCPNCGTKSEASQPIVAETVSLNPAADKIMCVLKDNLFLVLCILMSISCVLSLSGGLPLINILLTIFLWLTYADAQKGFANEKHLQCVSGTVYASYVITNVTSIILIVCGILFGALVGMFAGTAEFAQGFNEAISQYDLGELVFSYEDIPQALMGLVGVLIGVVFVLVGVIALVVNILGIKKIHSFAKSVYMGIMFQNSNFMNPRATKNWLMFFGICSAITAVFSLLSEPVAAITSGCDAAVAIIASSLINKYLVEKPQFAE